MPAYVVTPSGEIMRAEQTIINRIRGAMANGSAILVEPMQ